MSAGTRLPTDAIERMDWDGEGLLPHQVEPIIIATDTTTTRPVVIEGHARLTNVVIARKRLPEAVAAGREADLHEAGRFDEIGDTYDDVCGEMLPIMEEQNATVRLAFNCWDGWVDAATTTRVTADHIRHGPWNQDVGRGARSTRQPNPSPPGDVDTPRSAVDLVSV